MGVICLIKRNLRFGFDNLKLRNFQPRQGQSNGIRRSMSVFFFQPAMAEKNGISAWVFVARFDGVGMRRPQVVGRVTGQDSHAFLYYAH